MKLNLKYYLIATIIFLFLFSNCKKIPFDSRNELWGDWNFHYEFYSWKIGVGQYGQTSGDYKGKITYDKKDKNKNTLQINYIDGTTRNFEIDNQGNITCCGGSGKIENNNSISFSMETNACDHAMGGGTNYTVTGTKIK